MSLFKTVLSFGCQMMGVKAYVEDNLLTIQNHEFIEEPEFAKAYARGEQATGPGYNLRWRVHVALWAAHSASKLKGDFVECGVNKGFLSSAIMTSLDWNKLDKKFYLLDTFHGLDERFISDEERAAGYLKRNQDSLASGYYVTGADAARKNFSEWKNAIIVEGTIPDSLKEVKTDAIAYLHLDLNCSPPEVAALEMLWDKLVPGAFVLHDDYAQMAHKISKEAMDKVAASKGLRFVSLPTGQGLLIKPH
jgi:hypothetical protein